MTTSHFFRGGGVVQYYDSMIINALYSIILASVVSTTPHLSTFHIAFLFCLGLFLVCPSIHYSTAYPRKYDVRYCPSLSIYHVKCASKYSIRPIFFSPRTLLFLTFPVHSFSSSSPFSLHLHPHFHFPPFPRLSLSEYLSISHSQPHHLAFSIIPPPPLPASLCLHSRAMINYVNLCVWAEEGGWPPAADE